MSRFSSVTFPNRGDTRHVPWDLLRWCPLIPTLLQHLPGGGSGGAAPPPLLVPGLQDAPHRQSHRGGAKVMWHQHGAWGVPLLQGLQPSIFRDTAFAWSSACDCIIWFNMPAFHPNMWPKKCRTTFHTHLIPSYISAVSYFLSFCGFSSPLFPFYFFYFF